MSTAMLQQDDVFSADVPTVPSPLDELEAESRRLRRECMDRSGMPTYHIFDRQHKVVLRQIEAQRTLTRAEYIHLYEYQAWLDFVGENCLPEDHPLADCENAGARS